MKTMKQTFWFLLMLTALTLASCSKDDDDNKSEQPEEDLNSAIMKENLEANMMLAGLCDIDSVPGGGTVTYTPRLGKALYSATPTVYYTVANSPEEARSIYEGVIAFIRTDSLDTTAFPSDIKRGDVHLTFGAGSGEGETGRITVDCPRVNDKITNVVFLTDEAWPENDVSTPFNFLSLWHQKSTDRYYLCVREAKGSPGMMITWESGWWEDWFDSDWQGKFSLWADCPKQEVYTALGNAMQYNSNKFQSMMNAMNKSSIPHTSDKTWDMLNDFWNYSQYTRYFDCDYSYSKGRWWFATNYYITVRRATVKNRSVSLWQTYCEHQSYPLKKRGSYSFYFNNDYNNKNGDWEAIHR
jgi:hypothetical protein